MESFTLPTIALRKLPGINQMSYSEAEKSATKKVVAPVTADNPAGYVVIDAANFNPKTDKEYDGPDFDPVAHAEAEVAKAAAKPAE